MDEPGYLYLNVDAYLYEEHGTDCACSWCKPDEHGPVPMYWMDVEDGPGEIEKGWLYE